MGLLEVGPAAAALFEICGWELAAAAPSTSLAPVVSMRSGESNKWAAAGGVDTIQSTECNQCNNEGGEVARSTDPRNPNRLGAWMLGDERSGIVVGLGCCCCWSFGCWVDA